MADEEGSYAAEQTEEEREIFRRELDAFVPDRALDAHAHMWPGTPPDAENQPKPWRRETITLSRWRELMEDQMPGGTIGGLMLAVPQGFTASSRCTRRAGPGSVPAFTYTMSAARCHMHRCPMC